jgi:urea transport system ATP-binding protein
MVVEHDMDFVAHIAGQGKVMVLHGGSVLAEGFRAAKSSRA